MKVLILFFITNCFISYSQGKENNILYGNTFEKFIGINNLTKDSIYVKKVNFNHFISDFDIDVKTNSIIASFSLQNDIGNDLKKEILSNYNLDSNKILWFEKIKQNKFKYIILNGDIIYNQGESVNSIDILSGKERWKIKGQFYTDSNLLTFNTGLIYGYLSDLGIYSVYGVNLKNGEKIWSNPAIDLDFDKIQQPIMKDSNFIFLTEKIHNLSLKTGKYSVGIDNFYKYIDIKNEYYMTFAFGLTGYLIQNLLINPTYNYSNNNYKNLYVTSELTTIPHCSNFLQHKDNFYISTTSALYNYSYNGVLQNMIDLRKYKLTSSSILLQSDSNLYLINDQKSVKYSRPSFLKINLETKKIEQLQLNKENIIGIKNIENSLQFIQEYSTSKIDLNLNIKNEIRFSKFNLENASHLLFENCYRIGDNKIQLLRNDTNQYYIYDKDLNLYKLNQEFELVETINNSKIYSILYTDDKITVIMNSKKKKFKILNKSNQEIIEIEDLKKIQSHNSTYYFGLLNGIYIIDNHKF